MEEIVVKLENIWWRIRRPFIFWWQRRIRGFDDGGLWNLDGEFADWIAPRLKRFSEITNSHPVDITFEEWQRDLEKMHKGFDLVSNPPEPDKGMSEEDMGRFYEKQMNEEEILSKQAMEIFSKRWRALWL